MVKSLRALLGLVGVLVGLSTTGQAQTVATGSLSASAVCPPATLTVPFSATGPFGSGNVFTAQLSDASGNFSGTPTTIGSITANPASTTTLTITGAIPANTGAGSLYKVRVISSVGSKSSVSATVLSVGTSPPVAPATTPSFCQNTGTASVSATGQNLKWYNTPSATTVAGTGSTFPVSTTTAGSFSVYVTQTVNGCESAQTQVGYTVTAPPAAPGVTSITICQGQAPGSLSASFVTGATPNWYGTSQTSGTASTAAPIPSNTTSATYYVSQTVNGCESPRAALLVTVGAGLAAPVVSVPAPYCTNIVTPYPVATAVGTGLQWYNALGEAVGATAPIPSLPGTYTYTVSQSNGSCVSPKSAPYVITIYPKGTTPTLVTPAYCANNLPVALAVTGNNLQWFASAAGTTVIAQPVPTTATQTVYVQQTDANGCKSDIASLVVTVSAQPARPAVTSSITICAGTTAPLTATALSGNTLRWYGTNPSGTFTTSPVATTAAGVQYVSQVNGSGCESEKAQINVFVNPIPGAPLTTAPAPFCAGQPGAVVSATVTTAGATLRWYTDATNTTSFSASAPVPSTQTSSTYYVAQVDGNGCVGNRTAVVVTVKQRPATLVLTAAQSQIRLCQNQTSQPLTASLTDGTSLNWYADNSSTPLGGAPNPPTANTGTQVYRVAQVLDGCEGTAASLTVTVSAVPSAPTVTAVTPYCQGSAIPNLMATGQELKWYGTSATGGTSTTTQTPDNTIVGVTSYYVTQTVNGCESPRGSTAVQIKPTPGAPTTASVEFCQNTTPPILTAGTFGSATLNWYGTTNSGPSTATPPAVPNANAATLIYYVSQTLDGCEGPRSQLSVAVKSTPAAPATAPVVYCNASTAQPLTAAGQNLTWFDSGDNALGNAPVPNTGSVGTQVFKVTQTVNGCVSSKATLTVTINSLPAAPGITNRQYCLATQDQPLQFVGALTATGQNLKWYNPDGNVYGQTPTPPINQTATIVYQVTQTVNNCEGPKATLQVSVQTTPAPVVPSPLVTYCRDELAKPLEAVGTSLRWIDPNGTLLPANTTPTPPTLNATPAGGVVYQVYQTGTNSCVSPRSSIKVVINTNPTLALLGNTQIDLGQSAAVRLRFTGVPPFSYTLTGGLSGKAFGDTTVTVIPRQTTTYQVLSVANICGNGLPGDPATTTIAVRVPTIIAGNLNVSTLCAGNAFTVPYTPQGTFVLDMGYQVQLVSTADTSARNPITLNATGTLNNPITVTVPANTPGGGYAVRVVRTVSVTPFIQVIGQYSPSIITVRPKPTATLAGTQNLYEGSATSLTLTFGGDAPWSFAYTDSLRTVTGTATASPFLIPVQPLKTTTYRLTAVSNNCDAGTVSGVAIVTVLPLLGVDNDPLSDAVNAYPVPATTRLTVAIDRPLYTEPAHLQLVDTQGRVFLQQTTRTKTTDLDLSAQPAGLYMLNVTVGDRQTTRKILKQ